jgi:hypothetical protein
MRQARAIGGAGRSLRSAWLGALLCAAPALATAALLWRAAADVPAFDDYDAIVDFLNRWVVAEGAFAKMKLLLAQHVEHRPAVLRAAAAAAFGTLGHLDLRLLQAFGVLGLLVLAGALLAGFRPAAPLRERLLPFAPAALLLFHPQFWSAWLWPTCSAPNFYAVAFAAIAFQALTRASPAWFALAILAATAAALSQANGIAALPLGLIALRSPEARARRGLWIGFSLLLAAALLAAFERPLETWDATANLASPVRIARVGLYVLHFLGGAPAFSQAGLAPLLGAGLLASFAALLLRGAHRRSPALIALLAFLLISAGMNALVRVQQGVDAPLLADRYRFYACAFLAATWLAWCAELAGWRLEPSFVAVGVCASLLFSVASHARYRGDLLDFSRKLREGYERWWTNGDGGLFYPRFASASRILLTGYQRGVLRPPPAWFAAHGVLPREASLPEPGSAVRFRIGTLHLGEHGLLVDGWAQMGGTGPLAPRFSLVLRSPERTLLVPTWAVPVATEDEATPRAGGAGFRSLVPRASLPAGRYRVGLLVERADGAWLSFHADRLVVPLTRPRRASRGSPPVRTSRSGSSGGRRPRPSALTGLPRRGCRKTLGWFVTL